MSRGSFAEAEKSLRILVTNDDGINAPGLVSMEAIARALSDDVWVVAPERNQSGAAHSLTLAMPIRCRDVDERKFALEGTPTDCVLFATRHLLRNQPPDLVLSGVNRGANMADDITYSGTVAGAMEGSLLGMRSIALSQAYLNDQPVKWATAEAHAPDVIRKLMAVDWPREMLFNVNFPDVAANAVAGVRVTSQAHIDMELDIVERTDPRGGTYYWLSYARGTTEPGADSDLAAVRAGAISVTPLHLDLTHREMHRKLGALFRQ
jgi:5'-nucleotidase